jgi:hypothetical protein
MPNMIHVCEGCRRRTELYYCRSVDEYLCDDCITEQAERLDALADDEPLDPPGWEGGFADNH